MWWWQKRLFFSLFLILYRLFFAQALLAQECAIKPDATLRDAKTTGKPFVNCTSASTPNYTLRVDNISQTKQSNTEYFIDWGDGSKENLGDFNTVKSHFYTRLDTYKILFTVKIGDCAETKEYTFFNGGPPVLSIRYEIDDCAPVSDYFIISDVDKNEPATIYTIDFGDGSTMSFGQSELKKFLNLDPENPNKYAIPHTYSTPSFGKELGYEVTISATNTCRTVTQYGSGIYVYKGPTPDFKMTPEPVSCVNSPVTLTDISDYGYNAFNPETKQFERRWTIEPVSGQPATSWSFAPGYDEKSEKPVINFTQTGDYKISINLVPLEGTSPKCQGGTVSKNLKVVTNPVAAFSTTLTPLSGCAATVSTSNTSVGEAIRYQWTVTPSAGVTTINGSTYTSKEPVFRFTNAGNYTINLSVTNVCGTSTATPKSVAIKNIPTVTLPGAQTYCGPQTIAFSATNSKHKPTYNFNNSTPITYEWRVNSPTGEANFTTANGANTANPSILFSQVGVYTVSVTVTNECGISSQANQTVTINAIPTAPDAENASICLNSSATLTTAASGTVEWFSTASGGTRLNTLPNKSYTTPVQNTAGTFTYYVQTTVNGCTSPRKPVTVTVNPAIDPKVISSVPPICEGNAPNTLTGPTASGGGSTLTYLWESSTTSATAGFTAATGLANSPNNQQNFQSEVLTKPTWFRRKAIASPCATATSNTVLVQVNPLPAAPVVVPAISSVCVGNAATFTANAVSGVTFTWYDENGTVLPNNSAASNTYITASLTQTGTYTYYVSGKNSNNCTSTRTPVSVRVLPAITDNRISSAQPAICAGETPALISSDGQPSGGDGYNTFMYLWQSKTDRDADWKTAASGTNPEHANNKENYQPTAITRTTTFRRVITSGSCATPSYSNEVVIQVVPSSLEPEVAPVDLICTGESTQLQVTSTGGTYEWFTSATSTENIFTGSIFTTPALEATTTYYVHNRTTSCVSPRTPVVVIVNPLISKNTITPVPPTCADGTANTLEGTEPEGGAGPGTYTYRWESRTEFTSFAPINGDPTFSKDKKDYNPGNLKETTWFQRMVRSGTCESVSAELQVEVVPAITGNIISAAGGVEFCEGAVNTTLIGSGTMSGGTGQYYYTWESSTDEAFQINKIVVAQGQGSTFAEYSPQNLTQTTWFRRVTTSGPCLANISNVIKIKVNPLPAAPVVAPIDPICAGSAATITASLADGITFAVYDEAGNSLPAHTPNGHRFTTPALTEPKTYTYYVIATNSFHCSSVRTTVTVQVLEPLTNFNITQPDVVCTGDSPKEITSSGKPAGGINSFTYIWESRTIDETEFKAITASSSNPNFKPAALTKTTYFRRKITSGACSQYSNVVEVKVNQPIVNTLTATNQEICEDVHPDKITAVPATGGDGTNYTYLWESSRDNNFYGAAVANSGESNTQVTFQPTKLPQGDNWFRRKVISGACISYSAAILIKVNEPLTSNTISLTDNTAICINTKPGPIEGSTLRGGNGKPTYLWQSSLDGNKFTNAPQLNNLKDYAPGTLTQPTWFRRIVEAAACLPDTSSAVKVEVYRPVTNNTILTLDQEVCLGNTAANLVGSLPQQGNSQFSYRWEIREAQQTTFITATGNPFEKDYNPGSLPKGVWYFRRWVSAGPCQEVVSPVVKITVNNPLSGHFITANQIIRVGDKPATVTGPRPNGGNSTIVYRWESKQEENGVFKPIAGNTNAATYSPLVLNKTTWFQRIAVSGGCESVSNQIEITVAQAIANNTISANQTICYNAKPIMLAGSAPNGGDGDFTYIWEYSDTGMPTDFVTAPNLATNQDYQPGKLKENTWFRRKVSSAGNTHISNSIKVTVAEPITANTIAGAQTICYGSTPNLLTGSAVTGGNGQVDYLWETSTDGIHFLTAPGSSNQSTYAPGTLTRNTWYRRNVSAGGCANLASNTVQITVIMLPVLAPIHPVTICPGTSATLTVPSSNNQIEWFETASGNTPVHQGASFTTPILTTQRTYYVQAVSQGCAGERIPVKVLVEMPVANAGSDITIEAGKSVELLGKGGVTYQWAPAEGLSNPNIANPLATPTQTTRYTLTVTTAEGCTATDEVVIALLPGISVPNGFTPNYDGTNDVWEIANIEKYPDCQVKIFNRWGTIIYTSAGYKQPWDGTFNQQVLPVATYYYSIILKPGEKPVSGSVTIIK